MSLSREDANLKTYLHQVGGHLINVYSLSSWLIAFLGILPIWSGQRLLWLTAAFALLSALPATYRAWRDVVLAAPARSVLVVTPKSAGVNAPIDNKVPGANAKLDIRLDISNPTDDVLFLTEVIAYSWDVPWNLFQEPPGIKLYGQRERSGFGEMPLPVRFEPKARRDDLAAMVGIRPITEDERAFARALMKKDRLAIALRVKSENAARTPGQCDVECIIELETYKQQALNAWKRNGHTDLIAAAGNLE